MIYLDLKRIFASRGVRNGYTVMQKWGISGPTALNLLNNRVKSISFRHMEIICENLNCEPSDLFVWEPGKDVGDVETHPLKGLMRDPDDGSIMDTLKEIPLDRLKEARELLATLKNGG